METVTIPKEQYKEMKESLEILKRLKIYKRLLEFENNLEKGKVYSREDLGF